MYCSKCGKQIEDDAAFCKYCGAQIVGAKGSGKGGGYMNFKSLTCPNCEASIPYGQNIDHVTCNFCGYEIMLDDQASQTDRILRAQSNAKQRDLEAEYRYQERIRQLDEEKAKRDTFRKILPYLLWIGGSLLVMLIGYIIDRTSDKEDMGGFFIGMVGFFILMYGFIFIISKKNKDNDS